jgi:hypothetical protein
MVVHGNGFFVSLVVAINIISHYDIAEQYFTIIADRDLVDPAAPAEKRGHWCGAHK